MVRRLPLGGGAYELKWSPETSSYQVVHAGPLDDQRSSKFDDNLHLGRFLEAPFAVCGPRLLDALERATSTLRRFDRLRPEERFLAQNGWWCLGHTTASTLYPPNCHATVDDARADAWSLQIQPVAQSASSLHPGGASVLMADGSARFVEDSIRTAPYRPDRLIADMAKEPMSGDVWRALSTRSGGEPAAPDESP